MFSEHLKLDMTLIYQFAPLSELPISVNDIGLHPAFQARNLESCLASPSLSPHPLKRGVQLVLLPKCPSSQRLLFDSTTAVHIHVTTNS